MPETSSSAMIYLEAAVNWTSRGEIWLNDCPVQFWDGQPPEQRFIPVHGWLVDGVNRLELVTAAGPSPSRSRRGPRSAYAPAAQVVARVSANEPGGIVGDDGKQLAGVAWSAATAPSGPDPAITAAQFDLGTFRGRWAWQDAERIDLTTQRSQLLAFVKELHALFQHGNGEGLAAHCETYFDEMARAYPAWKRDFMRRRFVADIEKNKEANVTVDEFAGERIDFRLCAGGRLVEAVDLAWIPLLRARGPATGDVFSLPLFLGRNQGQWAVLR